MAHKKRERNEHHSPQNGDPARLMYTLLGRAPDKIEQTGIRTFLCDGVAYQIDINGNNIHVFGSRNEGDNPVTVAGSMTNLESTIERVQRAHARLSRGERFREVPNPKRHQESTYAVSSLSSGRKYVHASCSRKTKSKRRPYDDRKDKKEKHPSVKTSTGTPESREPIEVELGYLVPQFGYVNSTLQTFGVQPMVIGFQRVDTFGNPLEARVDSYDLPIDCSAEPKNLRSESIVPEQKGPTRRYATILAASLAAVLHLFTDTAERYAPPSSPSEEVAEQLPPASSSTSTDVVGLDIPTGVSKPKRKIAQIGELYITNSSESRRGQLFLSPSTVILYGKKQNSQPTIRSTLRNTTSSFGGTYLVPQRRSSPLGINIYQLSNTGK